MANKLEVGDRLDLLDLLSNYTHIVDQSEWDRLSEIFTEDANYDASQIGIGKASTLKGIQDWLGGMAQAPLHIAANSVMVPNDSNSVEMTSKWLVVTAT